MVSKINFKTIIKQQEQNVDSYLALWHRVKAMKASSEDQSGKRTIVNGISL